MAVPSSSESTQKHNATSQNNGIFTVLWQIKEIMGLKPTCNSTWCVTEHLLWIFCIIKSPFWNMMPHSLIDKYLHFEWRNLLNLRFSHWWYSWGFSSEIWHYVTGRVVPRVSKAVFDCLAHHGESVEFPENVGNPSPSDKVSHPSRPESHASELLSQQPQITHPALSHFGQAGTGIYCTNIQI
jgi:hypothetical protein